MNVQQQGEVRIARIDEIPADAVAFTGERTAKGEAIISHSETGNHHVLPAGVEVLERPLPAEYGEGMKILYALVSEPTAMTIDTLSKHHEPAVMAPGVYMLTPSIEVDPFTKQARRVAD